MSNNNDRSNDMSNTLTEGDLVVVWIEPTGFDGLTPFYTLTADHPSMDEVEVACQLDELPAEIMEAFGFDTAGDIMDEGDRYFMQCEVHHV
jgi:hypothetical protein